MVVDTVLGTLDPVRTNAACNMLGKISKFFEMQEKFGKRGVEGEQKEMPLLPGS
jgi:hypothetical protein